MPLRLGLDDKTLISVIREDTTPTEISPGPPSVENAGLDFRVKTMGVSE